MNIGEKEWRKNKMAPNQSKQKRIKERGKVLVYFEVDQETHKRLVELCNKEYRTISGMVRRILHLYLNKFGIKRGSKNE